MPRYRIEPGAAVEHVQESNPRNTSHLVRAECVDDHRRLPPSLNCSNCGEILAGGEFNHNGHVFFRFRCDACASEAFVPATLQMGRLAWIFVGHEHPELIHNCPCTNSLYASAAQAHA